MITPRQHLLFRPPHSIMLHTISVSPPLKKRNRRTRLKTNHLQTTIQHKNVHVLKRKFTDILTMGLYCQI